MQKIIAVFLSFCFSLIFVCNNTVVYAQTPSTTPSVLPTTPPSWTPYNPEYNIRINGYTTNMIVNPSSPTDTTTKGLVNLPITRDTDPNAPQLSELIVGNPVPTISSLYQIFNAQGNQVTDYGVTMVGFDTKAGQVIQLPNSGYGFGDNYHAVVLYATQDQLVLKWTPADSVVIGYTMYLDNLNVNPEILAMYNEADAAGRDWLPALSPYSLLGIARTGELRVAIRDTGSWMDPRVKKDWWYKTEQNLTVTPTPTPKPIKRQPVAKMEIIPRQKNGTMPYKQYPEESEQNCYQGEWAGGENRTLTYHLQDGTSRSQMLPNILNLDTQVKGTHCGQTKSQSVILKEISPFDPLNDPKCKTVEWMGEIQMNYGNTENFVIPFAEQIGEHWAGTLDAEHISDPAYQKLKQTAEKVINPIDPNFQKLIQQQNNAKAKIDVMKGVLKKLVSGQRQDELKCSFINYVKNKGAVSAYSKFSVSANGTSVPLNSIPCPPTVISQGKINQSILNAYNQWSQQWGPFWERMGLFPNEQSTGDLKFAVCEDKIYNYYVAYPEVFRMGLAANELFKVFTNYNNQLEYYKANNDQSNLQQPLDKNSSLALGPNTDYLVKDNIISSDSNKAVAESQFFQKDSTAFIYQSLNFANKIYTDATGDISTKLKSLYASIDVKQLKAQSPTPAPQNNSITVIPHAVVINGQLNYSVEIIIPPGVGGDLLTEVWKNGEKTDSIAINGFRTDKTNGYFSYGTPQSDGAFKMDTWPTYSPGDKIEFYVRCQNCTPFFYQENIIKTGCETTTTDEIKCTPVGPVNLEAARKQCEDECMATLDAASLASKGQCKTACKDAGIAAPKCDPKKQCCVTGNSCSADCLICKVAQKNPSDTTIWPEDYPHNHILLGVKWGGRADGYASPDPVKLTYIVPDYTPGQWPLPDGCQVVPVKIQGPNATGETSSRYCQSDSDCGDYGGVCDINKGVCGELKCVYEHERVINIYNNVPFLASAWKQAAGIASGKIPGGFLNIFKPANNLTSGGVIFDGTGNYKTNPAYSELDYRFDQSFGTGADKKPGGVYGGYNFGQDKVIVTQTSPKPKEKARVTFYRLGGLCNADRWASEQRLNPINGQQNPFFLNNTEPYCGTPGSSLSLPELNKDLKDKNMCNYEKPANDNGRCIHFLTRGNYSQEDFDHWVPILRSMGMTRIVALYTDRTQMEMVAKNFTAAGIQPIFRRVMTTNQAPLNYDWRGDFDMLKKYGINEPFVQLYNEPCNDQEWPDGIVPDNCTSVFIRNFTQIAPRIINAGGIVGIQLTDPEDLRSLIKTVKSQYPNDYLKYFQHTFFAAHAYADNLPPGVVVGTDGVLTFLDYRKVFQEELSGFTPPTIVTEGGYKYDPRIEGFKYPQYPAIDEATFKQYYQEIFNWFNPANNKLSDGQPLPNDLMAFCPWILDVGVDDAEHDRFKGGAWFNSLDGNRGLTVQTLTDWYKNDPFTRQYSCPANSPENSEVNLNPNAPVPM